VTVERLLGRAVLRLRGGRALALLSGPGAALNARLAALARDEIRRVTGRTLPVLADRTEYDLVATLAAANASRLSTRATRRWLRWQAAFLARGARGEPDGANQGPELREVHA